MTRATEWLLPPELRNRMRAGLIWSLVAALFSQGAAFGVSLTLANVLGREPFGRFTMIQSTLATLAAICQLANGLTATKFLAEHRSVDKKRAGDILGLTSAVSLASGTLAATALLCLAPWLAGHVLGSSDLVGPLMLSSVSVFFLVFNSYQMGTLAGAEAYRSLAINAILSGPAYLFLATAGARLLGLTGAVAGVVGYALLQFLVLYRFRQRVLRQEKILVSYEDLGSQWPLLRSFVLPAALAGFSAMPALWASSVILARQAGGFGQLALYGAAMSLRLLILFLPGLVYSVGVSLINNQRGLKNADSLRRLFWTSLSLTGGLGLAGSVGVVLFGRQILRMFGPSFAEGYPVLLILSGAAVLESFAMGVYQLVQAAGKMWLSFRAIALPRDATLVLAAWFLAPLHGAVGVALAYLLGQMLAFAMTVFVTAVYCRLPGERAPSSGREVYAPHP